MELAVLVRELWVIKCLIRSFENVTTPRSPLKKTPSTWKSSRYSFSHVWMTCAPWTLGPHNPLRSGGACRFRNVPEHDPHRGPPHRRQGLGDHRDHRAPVCFLQRDALLWVGNRRPRPRRWWAVNRHGGVGNPRHGTRGPANVRHRVGNRAVHVGGRHAAGDGGRREHRCWT
jgi:hypothetical protein